MEDLDLCLLASEARGGADWAAARARKRELIAEAAAVSAAAEAAYRGSAAAGARAAAGDADGAEAQR